MSLVVCLACALAGGPGRAFAEVAPSETAAPEKGAPEKAERRLPVPVDIGEAKDVIRLMAVKIVRWPERDLTVLDLRQGARIYQGPHAIVATRLLVWFRTSEKDAAGRAVVEVYGEAGTCLISEGRRTDEDAPAIYRLSTSEGVVVEGERSSGDAPLSDDFLDRAAAFRAGEPHPEEEIRGILRDIRPSSEELLLTDLSDDGVTVTLHGNARVASQDLTLSSDTIRMRVSFEGGRYRSPAVESIYAEGVVDFKRGNERTTAESMYFDVPMQQGLALQARIRTVDPQTALPVQFGSDAVRQLSQHRFHLEGPGFFTTSQFVHPTYRIEGRDVDVVWGRARHRRPKRAKLVGVEREDGTAEREALPLSPIVLSRNNLFYIGSVPVFYYPYLAKDVTTGTFLLKSLEVGSSGNAGQFIKVEWNLYDLGILFGQLEQSLYERGIELYEWSDLTLRTDYYSSRGFGIGAEFEYEGASRYGFLRAYHIRDSASEDDEDLPTPRESRGEITWRHREILPCNFSVDFELGYLSDRRFLRTYDRDEHDEGKDRETQVFIRWLYHNMLATGQLKTRINDFQNTVERQSVAFHIFGQQVFGSPILWTSHSDLGRMRLRYDEDLGLKDPDAIGRFDTAHELSWPLTLGPVRLDPFLWEDLTFFTEQARDKGAAARFASAYGLRAATNFYRTYFIRSDLFDIDRLRHSITPTLEYRNLFYVSKKPSKLIPHDEIDTLDESHRVTLGLRNRLETYRYVEGRKQRVDYLTFDVDYTTYLGNARGDRGLDDYVEVSTRWLVNDNITLFSEDNWYNLDKSRVEALNAGIQLEYWRPFSLEYRHKYYVDIAEPDEPEHSVGIFSILYQPEYSRWQMEFMTTYDFDASKEAGDAKDANKLGTALFFSRKIEDWVLSLGLELNQGRANDTAITFNIFPPISQRRAGKSWRRNR